MLIHLKVSGDCDGPLDDIVSLDGPPYPYKDHTNGNSDDRNDGNSDDRDVVGLL